MNIGEATAVNTVVRALAGIPGMSGQVPTVEEQQAAVDLLLHGANKALGAGLQPGEVTLTDPAVEVFHHRDPEASCTVTVWVGGREVAPARTENVDVAAGALRTEVEQRIAALADERSPIAKATHDALVAARADVNVTDDRDPDEQALDDARWAVRWARPTAVGMLLETSDQNNYGFVLSDVVDADGSRLSESAPDLLERLDNELWQHLCNLRWDGVVGEDRHGHAEVDLPPLR